MFAEDMVDKASDKAFDYICEQAKTSPRLEKVLIKTNYMGQGKPSTKPVTNKNRKVEVKGFYQD